MGAHTRYLFKYIEIFCSYVNPNNDHILFFPVRYFSSGFRGANEYLHPKTLARNPSSITQNESMYRYANQASTGLTIRSTEGHQMISVEVCAICVSVTSAS